MQCPDSGHVSWSRSAGGAAIRLAALGLLLTTAAAHAQPDPFSRGFDAVPVKPTAAQSSGIALEGATAEAVGSYRGALLLDFNWRILSLKLGDEKLGDLLPYRLDAHLLFSYQLLERLELGVDLPVTLIQGDNFSLLGDALNAPDFPGAAGVSGTTLGDIRLLPRVNLLNPNRFPVGLAVVTEVRLPTGSAQSFTGERGVVFAPRLAVDWKVGPLPVRVLGNAGVLLRPAAQYLNLRVDDELTLGAGGIVDLPDIGRLREVKGVAEMHLRTPLVRPFNFDQSDSLKTPWELLVGARAKVWGNWGVELDVGRGLNVTTGYGREALRVMLAVRYDTSGLDSDGDGVPDTLDRCPTQPEDKDDFEDYDGCPDPDNDGDGIADGDDACPSVKGTVETKGCPVEPDKDTDGDGIIDKLDKCPDVPGLKDFDGCPDTDMDEIPDGEDDCPDVAGPPENNGCPYDAPPYVVVESDRIRIKGNILFETNSAIIQKQSYPLLDEVAAVLAKNPTLGPVQIEGHTDNKGSRSLNLDLSKRRAKSVLDYLAGKKIDRKRLTSQGFGFDRPIDTNDTALGRAKNRRVDFKLVKSEIESGPKETIVPNGQPPPPGTQPLPGLGGPPATDAGTPATPAPATAPKPQAAPDAGTPAGKK
ncbi:OmpA family protein [Corallococcus sp. CA047B]|uniref:OmpA family protein n=1 Tax=Corallococcus sp. CA047B TaxID=2316729 RepID=UPI000EA0EA27|nr:OmpA family protein [Corallococcus sp. CA047B]RKH07972.1 OmpA family protein [Corallococcus sp. CA047B]